MPNVAVVLKQEISRVAKKEAKAFYRGLPGVLSSMRKTISCQKRKIAQIEAQVGKLEKRLGAGRGVAMPKPEELERSRLGASNIRKLRAKLNLTRAEMAKLIDASANSILLWESGKSIPRAAAKARIIALRKLGRRKIKKLLQELSAKAGAEEAKPRKKTRKTRKPIVLQKKKAKR